MPPKPKFTKDAVLATALQLLREKGEDALTARSLADALNCSTRPLFTLWANMDELKHDLRHGLALQVFMDACDGYQEYRPAFKQLGLNILQFATNEPQLFSFLFISKCGCEESLTLDQWATGYLGDQSIPLLMRDFDLDHETARTLFIENFLHCFSLCVLKVTGAAKLTNEEASASLTHGFMGTIALAKAGVLTYSGVAPDKEGGTLDGKPVGALPVVPVQDPRDA